MIEAAGNATTVTELAAEISCHVGLVVPHDGYALFGLDPLTGTVAFAATRNTYGTAAGYQLELNHVAGRDPNPFAALIRSRRPVREFGSGPPVTDQDAFQRELMAAEGVGSDLSIALTHRGKAWGGLALVRGADIRPFRAAEIADAARLLAPLTAALRRFVTRQPFRPVRSDHSEGVLVIDQANSVIAATATGRSWLRSFAPDHSALDQGQLPGHLLSVLVAATQPHAIEAQSRIPTPQGWVALHAQPLDGGLTGQRAVTIRPAAGRTLLSAVSDWYGLTPREQAIAAHILSGHPVKQIARRLDLSHHTVSDHLAAIYRKTGVTGRDELVTSLTP
ncbi:response regulator transcription factor [Actinoallomurus sp. CA-150999]|uniref:helix-turn-helix transcriptional regulator n=1 Tax=Actinoallomurus sp. CA-150999 TaxID=3239887 RepID=UPI003D8AF8C0